MYPHRFVDLAKGWLAAAGHPGISRVRTCADVGRWEQPVGLILDLADGWRFVLQCVGTSPDGGNTKRHPDSTKPDPFGGDWKDRPDYRTARARFEAEVGANRGPRSRRPQAAATALLAVALDAVTSADHPRIATVEIPDDRLVLKVVFDDGATIYGLPAGYLAPGESNLAHPAHHIPADWQREVTHVS